jgi:hypothetical protein
MERSKPDRRQAPRVGLQREAVAFVGNERWGCETFDVSRSGVGLRVAQELPVGQFLRVNLGLGAGKGWIDLDGVVVRDTVRAGSHLLGVQFVGLEAQAERLLGEVMAVGRHQAAVARHPDGEPPPPARLSARAPAAPEAAAGPSRPRRPPPPEDLLARCLAMKQRRGS